MPDDPMDHVFTLYPYHDVVIASGAGCRLTDTEGRSYLDLASGQLSAALGHAHPRLVRAAQQAAAGPVNLGNRFFGAATLEACAEIAAVCQEGLDRVVICSTGSEANELAVRIARAATGHHELVGVRRGYYGATHEMLSLSEYVGFIKGIGAVSPGVHKLPCPDCRHCTLGLEPDRCEARCVTVAAEHLREDSTGAIAAVLVEPVLGSGGIIVPPAVYLQAVRALADDFGALLIADEAQTGLGRTGRWMGMEHAGVVPDVCVLSKGLGAGYPVAAVITTAQVEARCIAAPLANMSSHSFDPFAGAIAAETIRTIRDEGLVQRAEQLGVVLADGLRETAVRHDVLGDVRGLGLMAGVDVVSRESGELDPLTSLVIEAECLLRGLVVGYSSLSGVLRVLPPLVITEAEIDEACRLLDQAVTYVVEQPLDLSRYLPRHAGSAQLAMGFIGQLAGS
jgi:2,2-dialkylglycine decarboxylase (pyruvate)